MNNQYACVINFGCRVNFYESNSIIKSLNELGIQETKEREKANYIIINTCTVTKRADLKNRSTIRKIYNENPNAKIIVTGCYATTDEDDIIKIPGVFSVINNEKKEIIPELIKTDLKSKLNISLKKFIYNESARENNKSRAYLKVQDGCDRTCSYCKIPLARGKAKSRNHIEVIEEAKEIINNNYKEIILTGINIGAYKDINNYRLNNLIEDIINISGDFLIRISSIEPSNIIEKIIPLFQSQKIARFLHIPLQSGSPQVLKKMRRTYTIKKYKNIINNIKNQYPEMHIGTDIILGFPGETEEDFKKTRHFCNENEFANIHVFKFSKREGTFIFNELEKKSKINTKEFLLLNKTEIQKRTESMLTLKEALLKNYIKKTSGIKFKAIIEKITKESVSITTENYLKLNFSKSGFENFKKGDLINLVYNKMGDIISINNNLLK
ncbi:MAG: tRNA (N(6)-L-threonylcarbamoyladenosine(37)-C(2))-methylthiotransferase MtaB [Spirochaetia bacterium]|nr:tRNA (N(6)-L-threonylcarbamoyladenosine(37)-C(2))-methylthiotransferase MtaB [Spirochaetia bacterium]